MEVVCTLAQALFVVLLLALFFAGLAIVIGALGGFDSSPRQIARRIGAELEEIASEGKRAMDDLSEQYLNKVYDQVTRQRRR